MRVEVFFAPYQVEEAVFRDKTVVVIDVLRASTTIATALLHGAKEVIPVETVESAMKISSNLFGEVTLLGGERQGKIIGGFHLGNSPLEYTEEKVKGKSIIFTSTNGSLALGRSRYAKEMVVCGFVNLSVVRDFLRAAGSDFVILCAGRNGMFSMEDSVCAGMLVHKLSAERSLKIVLSDAALAAVTLYKSLGKVILKMLRNSEHGKYLTEIGFGPDLDLCAAVDTVPVLPQLDGTVIRWKRENERNELSRVSVSS